MTARELRENLLNIAKKEVGYTESPPGSNRTKYGKWYGLDGNPWCMMFVMWCFQQLDALSILPMRSASCGQLMRKAQELGVWVGPQNIQPGDILIFDFPGNAVKTDHTGICESVMQNGGNVCGAYSIEGNTGTGNDANGGAVMRRTRPVAHILGAVRPAWDKIAIPDPAPVHKVGNTVRFTGSTQHISSDKDAKAVKATPCTAKITYIKQGGGYPYHVVGSGVEGWVSAADLLSVSYIVTAQPSLNIRRGPGTEYDKIGSLRNGETVLVLDEQDGWGQLPGGGWVKMSYLQRG